MSKSNDRYQAKHNQEVRDRDQCIHCGQTVLQTDYSWKYGQAGGLLTGPFCGRSCQIDWLLD